MTMDGYSLNLIKYPVTPFLNDIKTFWRATKHLIRISGVIQKIRGGGGARWGFALPFPQKKGDPVVYIESPSNFIKNKGQNKGIHRISTITK